jgi:hypothetical protein
MQATWCRNPLGVGPAVVAFESVQREPTGAFNKPVLVWTFSNDAGVARIVTGTNFSLDSAAGKLLSVISGEPAKVGCSVEIDNYRGKNFNIEISQDGDRRMTRLVSGAGDSISVNGDE